MSDILFCASLVLLELNWSLNVAFCFFEPH